MVNGTSKRRRKYDTREQLEYLEVANFRIRNPADTFEYDIVPAAITAARQLNLPLITGTDTLMTLGLAQTVTGILTLTTPAIGAATGTSLSLTGGITAVGTSLTALTTLAIRSTGAAYDLTLATDTVFTAGRTVTIRPGDAARIVTISADATIGGTTSGTNTGDVTLAGTPNYITLANQVLTLTKLDPADDLNTFASSVLATLVTDETGSGALVFGTAPTIAGGAHTALTGLGIRSTGTGAYDMTLANAENLTVGRTLTIQLGDAARTLILGASPSLSGTNTGDQTITLTGDVTGSGTGSFAATIANDAVTLAKMANMATGSLLGRNTAATGDPEVITDIPTAITIGGAYVYRVSGTDVALADGGTGASLTDPNADRIMFWDDSAGVVTWLSAGTGLTISGTEITASGAAGAVTRVGGNTTEATTTSTSLADLLAVSSLAITAATPFQSTAVMRKTTGAANTATIAFVANTTLARNMGAWSSSNNSADQGSAFALFGARVTGYLQSGMYMRANTTAAASLIAHANADMETANLTSVTWQGSVADAAITMGMDEAHVYTFAVS